jgi:DNA repair photolyase
LNEISYREIAAKSALNRVQGMPFDWSLNPYIGCTHSCVFCYARAYNARYRERDVGPAFDRNIEIRANFVERLYAELRRRPGGSVAIGTATDPYQPIEGKYRLTRGSLEALVRYPMPTSIVTKGTLVVRDIDVLQELDRRTDLTVYFSVPSVDEGYWRRAEPGAPPPWQRLRALRMLREAGLDAAVLCAPLLPGISDGEESIDRAARAASEAGATAFRHRPLKIDSEIRDYYFDFLATEFPVLVPAYSALYRGSNHPTREYERKLECRVAEVRSRYEFRERPAREHSEPVETEQLALAI